jgi:hypothetical protein
MNTASTVVESSITSETTSINYNGTRSILSIKYIQILHSRNLFPQNRKYDLKSYIHVHGIDMQIHSIPKSPNQKIYEMGLSNLHEDEFKLFAMEYNYNDNDNSPSNELDYYVSTLEHHNEDCDPEINDMFSHNLDPTFYAVQIQNSGVVTHSQMKRKFDADKFIEAQKPEIEGLREIVTLEFIPKRNLSPKKRYLDLIWIYRCKRHPDGSLKKYKARLCVNGSRQMQDINYTESFAPVVQWSTIQMVNTLVAMHE